MDDEMISKIHEAGDCRETADRQYILSSQIIKK